MRCPPVHNVFFGRCSQFAPHREWRPRLARQAADGLPPFGGRAVEGAPEELVFGLAYEPGQAVGPQALLKSWRLNGRTRTRFPVRAKTAFATAGPIGGTPGSPTPEGSSVDGTMWTSTSGISSSRRTS